jgi:hypothetical protein
MQCCAVQQIGVSDFRVGSQADISLNLIHVRFTPESGHSMVLYWWAIRNGCTFAPPPSRGFDGSKCSRSS